MQIFVKKAFQAGGIAGVKTGVGGCMACWRHSKETSMPESEWTKESEAGEGLERGEVAGWISVKFYPILFLHLWDDYVIFLL